MAEFSYRTRGNSSPKNKPRVYFTCHPEDFERYFNKICEDIFKTHDCAVYYTEDMTVEIEEENKTVDLGQMNLFVVPVTFQLLTTPNRAMDMDFAYAKEEHIPILPIMMESGIDEFYARPDKFGERQYINPFSLDLTEISYEEKLKKYLESVLIGDEMAKRVRAAFDAYIFLSYRKKDRRYANELMRLIHAKPECRDIAIWYDEYLTIGESFKENIGRMLKESKLFTMLVTPNLLEYPDGKPNFVMEHEYPEAKKTGMDILPAEMVETDKAMLSEKYLGIPECVNPYEEESFCERMLASISKIAVTENDDGNDPEHMFLIGLAYLDGIDVETNRKRGVELVTKAAEAEFPEAMWALWQMYVQGNYVKLDYSKAVVWMETLADLCLRKLGETDLYTMKSLDALACTYDEAGEHEKAHKLHKKIYALYCEYLGEKDPSTLRALHNLAANYGDLGKHLEALELKAKAYALLCEVLGEKHPGTLTSLNNLAYTYYNLNNFRKARELMTRAYTQQCEVKGKKDPITLASLHNLALIYSQLGNNKRALKLHEESYIQLCEILGEINPNTLTSLACIASTYNELGDHKKALELYEKVYTQQCKVIGIKHPSTLGSLHDLAHIYAILGDYRKAHELMKKAYVLRCDVLGEKHPDTLKSMSNLASNYGALRDYKKAIELHERVYTQRCIVIGEKHPDTLTSLNNLAGTYMNSGKHRKALPLLEKAYIQRCEVSGEYHSETQNVLNGLICACVVLKDHKRALELMKKRTL